MLIELPLQSFPIQSLIKSIPESKPNSPHPPFFVFHNQMTTFRPNTPSGIFVRRSCRGIPVYDFVNLTTSPPHPSFRSLDFVSQRNEITILQSCNGLLLCSSESCYDSMSDFYIYNPTTKQFTTLPKLHTTQNEKLGLILGVNLAFDPSKSLYYKVICVHSSHPSLEIHQVEIYASETGSWKSYQGTIEAPFEIKFQCGVYWNGAIHWISSNAQEKSFYLNLSEEKIYELPMPPPNEDWEERRVEYFSEYGGHLNLIEVYEFPTWEIDVYEMRDDRSGWFVNYRVDLCCVSVAFPKMISTEEDWGYCKFQILFVIRSEVDEESGLVLLISGEVVRVSVDGKRFEKLDDIPEEPKISHANVSEGFGEYDTFLYIESEACV